MEEDIQASTVKTIMSPFTVSLIAGSGAGTAVDSFLFPLDTIKTRLQSSAGFWKSGGFSRIYRGIGPAFVGSAPTAAVFFATYDTTKLFLAKFTSPGNEPILHMTAATLGEIAACLIRVPVEIVKQRRQVSAERKVPTLIQQILKNEGALGFYRGYLGTIMREIPFSVIQFPLWEFLKSQVRERHGGSVSPLHSSICGAIAGGFSAAVTTPLDVVKTRIMLAETTAIESKGQILLVMNLIYRQQGVRGLFAGVVPRTMWISIGGSIFFGTYELIKHLIS